MFTGLIEEVGTIRAIQKGNKSASITIDAHVILDDVKLGDSIAVNGICLTVTDFTKNAFSVDAMAETMKMTTLNQLKVNEQVHLERALEVGGRLGGHMVYGHIDGIGTIHRFKKEGHAVLMTIAVPHPLTQYMVHKGSIAIDGVSLTLINVEHAFFQVGIIPMTGHATLLLHKKVGDMVNIECDVMGKYIEKLCVSRYNKQEERVDEAYLRLNGFL